MMSITRNRSPMGLTVRDSRPCRHESTQNVASPALVDPVRLRDFEPRADRFLLHRTGVEMGLKKTFSILAAMFTLFPPIHGYE